MKCGDRWLERFQVVRDLGHLDLCDVEQLSSEEGNWIPSANLPRGQLELSLCLLQDREFLRPGPWVVNHPYPLVPHSQLARGDSEHLPFKLGKGCRAAKVQKSSLVGGELVRTLQDADAPGFREGCLGFGDPPMRDCVVVHVQPKLAQGAHPEAAASKQTCGHKLSAESQPCLHLIAVHLGYGLHCKLACEGTLDLHQDNGTVKGLEVTIRAAGYFTVERAILGKVERESVTEHRGVVAPLNVLSSEGLEERPLTTSNIFAQVWRVERLAK